MSKLVIFKFVDGTLKTGFKVILQISEDSTRPFFQTIGQLPSAPEIDQLYTQWQNIYRSADTSTHRTVAQTNLRLEIPSRQVTNVSITDDCDKTAQALVNSFNTWLRSEVFRTIREGLLENLKRNDEIRMIIQTENAQLKRLPWHLWEVVERYPRAEVALGTPNFGRVQRTFNPSSKIRILAILGSREGIHLEADQALVRKLPNAEVKFLVEPKRKQLNDQLWEQGWDVLFFAGHSSSQPNAETGRIYINDHESLTIVQLRYALKRAVEKGLRLAIFNSCDGLGLARDLTDLQIPQIIVMREPVPDLVAQEFLKSFLEAFAGGESFYLAMREAREKLQGLEDRFPCATWLPVICQNPAETPPTWSSWQGVRDSRLVGVTEGSSQNRSKLEGETSGFFEEIEVGRAKVLIQTRKASHNTRSPAPAKFQKQNPSLKKIRRAGEQLAARSLQLYQLLTWTTQTSIQIVQLAALGGIGGCIGAGIGFWLTYWSPLAAWIRYFLTQPKFNFILGFSINIEPAMLVFALGGLGTALGLCQAQSMERRQWSWTPLWLGSLGYVLAWLSWQPDSYQTSSSAMANLTAIAAFFLIIGQGLREHPLLHAFVAVFGTSIAASNFTNWGWLSLSPFILLLPGGNSLSIHFNEPLFWASLRFFGLLGILISLWLGISYYVILPCLTRACWNPVLRDRR